MRMLVLICPKSRKEFSTGIQIDESGFLGLPEILNRSDCPHCGLTHNWWTHEAQLAETVPANR